MKKRRLYNKLKKCLPLYIDLDFVVTAEKAGFGVDVVVEELDESVGRVVVEHPLISNASIVSYHLNVL